MQERRELTEEEKAYKPITENPIQIDLGSITDKFSLCRLLKQKLGLPDFAERVGTRLGTWLGDSAAIP